jgi:hypothetical protein
VHFRPLRSLSSVALLAFLLLGLAPLASAAGEKDKEAMKLFDQAMGDDYLNTDFAKAEKKLKDALKKCGDTGCSASVVGKIHIALGTLYGVGLNRPDQAKEAFIAALKIDPKALLDDAFSTADLVKIFNEAKKSAGPAKASGSDNNGERPTKKPAASSSSGDAATHTPPAEQALNTPIPLYLVPSDEVPLSKVTLRYKPFGGRQYKSLEMKAMGKGFGAEIPCEDVTTTGDIKYFFALMDEHGEAAGTLGSTREPFTVTIKREIESEPLSLPGQKPPEQCKEKADCPPGLPGCPAVGQKRGDKGWGSSCEQTLECQAGLVCLNGSCEQGKDDGTGGNDGDKEKSKTRHHLIGLIGQLDALVIASKEGVCSPGGAGNYVCFRQGTGKQFDGPIAEVPGTNGIEGGFNLAGGRVLASYSYLFSKKIPISAGLQAGYAFSSYPSPENTKQIQDNRRVQPAKAFLAAHAEVRGTYHFLGSTLDARKFRPYAFVGFGIAGQVNGSVRVRVCDLTAGAMGDQCDDGPGVRTIVDAYQITGLNFVDFGGGTTFGITPSFGVSAELKVMLMLPTFGLVFAPTIGPVLAF